MRFPFLSDRPSVFFRTIGSVAAFVVLGLALFLLARNRLSPGVPQLEGLWLTEKPRIQFLAPPALTPFGRDRRKNLNLKADPNMRCLPPGPTVAFDTLLPFQILQRKDYVVILFEWTNTYRIIYLNQPTHPQDISEYPEWMGHSTGKYENGELVVDTVGIDARSWLTRSGWEHGGKLHLVERFKRVDSNTLQLSVTAEDPEYFTQPVRWEKRFYEVSAKTRLMSHSCVENAKTSDDFLKR